MNPSPPSLLRLSTESARRPVRPIPREPPHKTPMYCTWSDVRRKRHARRRRKSCFDSDDSDSDDLPDPLNDTLAAPQPKNFLHGTLIKRFRKPDPTPQQLEEYWEIKSTKEWRVTKHSFIKWISSNKEFRFAGTASVGHFVEWNRNMRTHFKDCDVYNTVCQFEVATTTFTKNARNWWDAHCLKRPDLLVTYEQLLEWIRHELVPDSNPALAYMEWSNLRYRGNIDEYMKHVDRLMDYFPIQRDTMIACIARPISSEFAAELRNMDIRLEGMSDPKIKEVIRNHLTALKGHQGNRYHNQERHIPRNDPDRRFHQSQPLDTTHVCTLPRRTPPKLNLPRLLPPRNPPPAPNLSRSHLPTHLSHMWLPSMGMVPLPATCVGKVHMVGSIVPRKSEENVVCAGLKPTGRDIAVNVIDLRLKHASISRLCVWKHLIIPKLTS